MKVYIDFKSPASYLAMKPTWALIDRLDIDCRFLPYVSRPFRVPEEATYEDIGTRHRRVRAISQRRHWLKYAGIQKSAMQFQAAPKKTDMALVALLHLQSTSRIPRDAIKRFITLCFKAYWSEQRNLDAPSLVQELLGQAGLGKMCVEADFDRKKLEDFVEKMQEQGVIETPFYVLDDGQKFWGREHLPWIEACLTATK